MASKIHLVAPNEKKGEGDMDGRPLALGVNNTQIYGITDNRRNCGYGTVKPSTPLSDSLENAIAVARGMIESYKQQVADGQVVREQPPSDIYLAVSSFMKEHLEDNKCYEHLIALIQWERDGEMKELITECNVLVEMPQPQVGDYMRTERTQHGFKMSFGRFLGVKDADRWFGDRASIERVEKLLNQIPVFELIKDLSFEEINGDVTLRRILHEQLRKILCNGEGRHQMPVTHVIGVSHEDETLGSLIALEFGKSYVSLGKVRGANANCRRIDYQSPYGVRKLSIPNRTTLTRESKVLIVCGVDTTAECVHAAIRALEPYELAVAPKILTVGQIQGLENLGGNMIDLYAQDPQPAVEKLRVRVR